MMEGERFIYNVNTMYFAYLFHCMKIVIYNIIRLFILFFTLIYFQSFILDDLLLNLLLYLASSVGEPKQTLDCIDFIFKRVAFWLSTDELFKATKVRNVYKLKEN